MLNLFQHLTNVDWIISTLIHVLKQICTFIACKILNIPDKLTTHQSCFRMTLKVCQDLQKYRFTPALHTGFHSFAPVGFGHTSCNPTSLSLCYVFQSLALLQVFSDFTSAYAVKNPTCVGF